MIYFTAHTFKCVCHCRRAMFRVLGMYNFDRRMKNVHINVRPHILLPKVVSMKNSHFSTENANVVT